MNIKMRVVFYTRPTFQWNAVANRAVIDKD